MSLVYMSPVCLLSQPHSVIGHAWPHTDQSAVTVGWSDDRLLWIPSDCDYQLLWSISENRCMMIEARVLLL